MATLTYQEISNHFGWSLNAQLSTITQLIDFSERRFIDTILYSVLCMFLWTVLPHLQFKFNLLSRLVGNDYGKAADFLAYIIIYSGCSRNYAFSEAINNNYKIDFGAWNYLILPIGYILIIFGLVIVAFSFYRLGLRGMYFGDHFGFLFKEKIVSFPYNIFENAQYVGTCCFFTGLSITHLSPAGLFLTLFINVTYSFLNYFESSKLAIFYPSTDNDSKTK
jgi:methylene-fatty-acyl-phospholipid synthase